MESTEHFILRSLMYNDEYMRKVLPFIKSSYFADNCDKRIFNYVFDFIDKYNSQPTKETLIIRLSDEKKITEDDFNFSVEILNSLEANKDNVPNLQWAIDSTEKFCKERAIYNALSESIYIADGKNKKKNPDIIPEILSEALAVSFDTNIGHDWSADAESRWEHYHRKQNKIPFDLEYLNKITKGGVANKTLNVILAPTGAGKSLTMCHFAANNLMQGDDVLYITCEMSEEEIAKRIDTNLYDLSFEDLEDLPKQLYMEKMEKLRKKVLGKLVIKEYPTSTASVTNFRHLLNELKLKRKFIPKIIYIDYINICASSRMRSDTGGSNSYAYIKAIAEEFRGLAVEYDLPIWTATQSNRGAQNNSDIDLTNVSESFGLPATADLFLAVIRTDELDEMNQLLMKQLKNRYDDMTKHPRFIVGVNRSKMKLYDVESSAQKELVENSGNTEIITDRQITTETVEGFVAPEAPKPKPVDRNFFSTKKKEDKKDFTGFII